jgi:hypothetical protein
VESARTTQAIRLGYDDSATSAAPTDGVWLEIVGNGTGVVISGKTASNSTSSTTSSTYTLAISTWVSATVEINSNASLVTYTLRSEAGAVIWTDTLATNIPTGSSRNTTPHMIGTESTTDAAALMFHLDYACYSINRILNR